MIIEYPQDIDIAFDKLEDKLRVLNKTYMITCPKCGNSRNKGEHRKLDNLRPITSWCHVCRKSTRATNDYIDEIRPLRANERRCGICKKKKDIKKFYKCEKYRCIKCLKDKYRSRKVESKLQGDINADLRKMGIAYNHREKGRGRGIRTHNTIVINGKKMAHLDLTVFSFNARCFTIELKDGNKKLSQEQENMKDYLQYNGHTVYTVRNWTEWLGVKHIEFELISGMEE